MPCRLNVVVVVTALTLAGISMVSAQSQAPAGATHPARVCSGSAVTDKRASTPVISLLDVQFEGDIHMPVDEQERIATVLKQRVYPALPAATASQIETLVRNYWQERGYFKVSVGKTEIRTLTSSPTRSQIAATVQVEDGLQYRLGSVTFKDNKVFRDPAYLRTLLPIADGELFDPSKVRAGLGNLRAYATKHGYINFTAIPDAQVNDEHQTISLIIDIDEGRQFHISSVRVIGLDDPRAPFAPGQVYDEAIAREFLKAHGKFLPADRALHSSPELQLNERTAAVAVIFDFKNCPASRHF